ncbi:MAG: hypothetical protein ACE5PT_05070 [Gemmatimonadales bacterium]
MRYQRSVPIVVPVLIGWLAAISAGLSDRLVVQVAQDNPLLGEWHTIRRTAVRRDQRRALFAGFP